MKLTPKQIEQVYKACEILERSFMQYYVLDLIPEDLRISFYQLYSDENNGLYWEGPRQACINEKIMALLFFAEVNK